MEQFFPPKDCPEHVVNKRVLLQLQDVVCSEFDWITRNNLRNKRISQDGNKNRAKYLINRKDRFLRVNFICVLAVPGRSPIQVLTYPAEQGVKRHWTVMKMALY